MLLYADFSLSSHEFVLRTIHVQSGGLGRGQSSTERVDFSEYFRFSLSAVLLMLPVSFLNIHFNVDLFVSSLCYIVCKILRA